MNNYWIVATDESKNRYNKMATMIAATNEDQAIRIAKNDFGKHVRILSVNKMTDR